MALSASRKHFMRVFISALMLCGPLILTPGHGVGQETEAFLSLGEERELHSDVLGEDRSFIVGLPAGYESGEDSYPVVYLLDGPGNFLHTTGTARFLARNGRMPGVIIVAIRNTDRTRDMTAPVRNDSLGAFPNAGGVDDFLEFIGGELRPFIGANYRTRPFSILIGHSFGGLVATHALVHRPELFDAYVSISPSLWWDEQLLVEQADAAFDDMDELVGDFYMTMGNEGGDMLGGALKFAGVLEAKAPSAFRWEFNHMDEEDHGSVPYRSTYYGLEKIFDGWNLHDPVALYLSGGLAAVDRYFERASERFGYERNVTGGDLNQIGARAISDEDASGAADVYSRVVEGDPNSAEGHFGLGEAHALMGHGGVAIEHYQHALTRDPRHRQAREKLTESGVDLSEYPEDVVVPVDVLESYVGTYSDGDDEYDIVVEGQAMALEFGGTRYDLYPTSNSRFRLVVAPVSVIFRFAEDGSVAGLTIDQGGDETKADRVNF